jgi:hypothetical protein
LHFVYEQGLKAIPTMAAILCYPGFWVSDPRTGVNAARVLHGEQKMTFLAARGETRVLDVEDKGKDKGGPDLR